MTDRTKHHRLWKGAASWARTLEPAVQMAIQIASAATAYLVLLVLAQNLGASLENDAFSTAYAVAGRATILLVSIVTVVWIPFLTGIAHLAAGDARSRRMSTAVYTILAIAAVISLAMILAADWLVGICADGMPNEGRALTARLLRLFAPLMFLQSAAAIGGGILNVRGRFLFAASGRLIMNLIALAGFILLPGLLTHRVALGLLGGGVLYLLVTAWFCRDEFPHLAPRMPHYDRSFALLGFGVLALFAQACMALAETMVFRRAANSAGVGSSTILTLALGVTSPTILAVQQLVVRAYPEISRAAHSGVSGRGPLKHVVGKAIGQIVTVCALISVLLVFLSRPICYVLFHGGAFSSTATDDTARALSIYSLCTVTFVTNILFSWALLALRKYWVLVALSTLEFSLLFGLAAMLAAPLGVIGIVLAHVLAVSATCVVSGSLLYGLGQLHVQRRTRRIVSLLAATAALCITLSIGNTFLLTDMTISKASLLTRSVLVGCSGIAIFVLLQLRYLKENIANRGGFSAEHGIRRDDADAYCLPGGPIAVGALALDRGDMVDGSMPLGSARIDS